MSPAAGVRPDERRELTQLRRRVPKLERTIERLKAENARLREALEKARRGGKRQAAPFAKGTPKPEPKKPGRKRGDDYGKKGHRRAPDKVDEVVIVNPPEVCPFCGGVVQVTEEVCPQFQVELPPVKPHVTRFDVHKGHCTGCRRPVVGRDPRQSSNARGAASTHLGPRALSVAAQLHTELGLSFGKVERVFEELFGLPITRGGLAQAAARTARALTPTYDAMVEALPKLPMVTMDESGWHVGGLPWWLWVAVGGELVVYAILEGRGFEQASELLAADYAGRLMVDGWAAYRGYTQAILHACNAHLLRRCHELLETADRGAARVPHAVRRLLKAGLALRDLRDADDLSPAELSAARVRLEAKMDSLLLWKPKNDENRKLLKHLENLRPGLFLYLDEPGLPATNFLAEQAIRPAVVNRKVWGGNRTGAGAVTTEILASFFATARKQHLDPTTLIVPVLRSPHEVVAPLRGLGTGPPPPT